jgi:hypothetical protein
MIPEATVAHYEYLQGVQTAALLIGRRAWGNIDPGNLSASWSRNLSLILPSLVTYQELAAASGMSYAAQTLAEQGLYEAPEAFVNPAAFAGTASDGRPLESLLYAPAIRAKTLIGQGVPTTQALKSGGKALDAMMRTQVADAGRAAAGVDIAARPNTGYVRMLNPPSCSRCSVLAGRFYRWNAGFNRHPRCDCVHVASTQAAIDGGRSEGLIHDPYEYFQSLPAAEQDRQYTAAGAQAIRDGSDIFQVVNSRRGMKPGGLLTSEGTSRRGSFRAGGGGKRRLTPEAIYQQAGTDREKALQLLEKNGYILPGGQTPAGSIVGQREGFGALGRGGTRVGARTAVETARETGARNPGTRATMTEAERRTFDARQRWDEVRAGRNPYGRSKLTPELAAAVEDDYRQVIVMGDSQWKLTARLNLGAP